MMGDPLLPAAVESARKGLAVYSAVTFWPEAIFSIIYIALMTVAYFQTSLGMPLFTAGCLAGISMAGSTADFFTVISLLAFISVCTFHVASSETWVLNMVAVVVASVQMALIFPRFTLGVISVDIEAVRSREPLILYPRISSYLCGFAFVIGVAAATVFDSWGHRVEPVGFLGAFQLGRAVGFERNYKEIHAPAWETHDHCPRPALTLFAGVSMAASASRLYYGDGTTASQYGPMGVAAGVSLLCGIVAVVILFPVMDYTGRKWGIVKIVMIVVLAVAMVLGLAIVEGLLVSRRLAGVVAAAFAGSVFVSMVLAVVAEVAFNPLPQKASYSS